jgi:filamentous hemagglutinin family protein
LYTTNGTVIQWGGGFDIGAGESVQFHQYTGGSLSADSAVLNRILTGSQTVIDGMLQGNGQVFVVNPSGIMFGGGAVVNVTQLVASALDISNADFAAGHYEFTAMGDSLGEVINKGTLGDSTTESIALLGKKVANYGTIRTKTGGVVVMASGDRVLLGEPGENIIVEMDSVEDGTGTVTNQDYYLDDQDEVVESPGLIDSPAGTVVLAAGDIYSMALRAFGGTGTIEQNGTVNADGVDGDGGTVTLTGADAVTLGAGSTTSANAGTDSDAGLVTVHSRGRADIEAGATISATGGSDPVHPPEDLVATVVDTTVEISADYINLAGDVDASATDGKRGKVVIDGLELTVADGDIPVEPVPDNTVYEEWIEAQSQASTDVELVMHSSGEGDLITVGPITDGEITGGTGDIIMRTSYDTGGIKFLPLVQPPALKPVAAAFTC